MQSLPNVSNRLFKPKAKAQVLAAAHPNTILMTLILILLQRKSSKKELLMRPLQYFLTILRRNGG